jgi:hypothetical protein
MELFYVSCYPGKKGFHELHKSNCDFLPNMINRKFLGHFKHIHKAIKVAQKTYQNTITCSHCITCI